MIVSHKLGCIFIKTRKTAGTSVELALSTLCGPADIVTPVTPKDEQLRQEIDGVGPQNHLVTMAGLTVREAASWARHRTRPKRFYNHMPARDVKYQLGRDLWQRYFSFTIERNPWDKAVSRYFWDASRREVPDFSTFLRTCPPYKLTCFDLYSERGMVIVNRVIDYRHLSDEMTEVWDTLGVRPVKLLRAKGSHRPTRVRDYRSMYSDDDAAFIATLCSREIDTFGYVFDDATLLKE